MTSNTATVNPAEEYIQHLKNNHQELKKLRDATAADIVQAGKDAGYEFTESDLDGLIQHASVIGISTNPAPQMGWGGIGDNPNPCH